MRLRAFAQKNPTIALCLTSSAVALMMVGCTPKPVETESPSESGIKRLVTERPTTDGLVVQEVDLNEDGNPDVFNYFKPLGDDRRLVRKELDLNLDGRIDVISFFDETGKLEREDMDGDFDGKFNHVYHYQEGRRVMAEWDTDYDGKPNIFVYYENANGKMVASRKERDTTGDGLIDYWERYDAEGNVVKIGKDIDGDGKIDIRDE